MKVILNKGFFVLIVFTLMSCTKDSDAQETNLALNKEIAQKILEKTNEIRKSQGKLSLVQNDEMDALATLHSENMVTYDFFDHVDHEGKTPAKRADALSYSWTSIAENIGQVPWFENVSGCGDTRSAEAISSCVVAGWENSPGHYTNMIGDYAELGVDIAFTKDSLAFFTQVFRNP
jgi:uncharacterized protein YkwD